jgi:hypothetical protein
VGDTFEAKIEWYGKRREPTKEEESRDFESHSGHDAF